VDIRAESRFDELSTTFTQPSLTVEQDLQRVLRASAQGIGRADSKFRNPDPDHHHAGRANVNGYAIDFRGNDRLPVISYPFDVTQPGGALQMVGVPRWPRAPSPTPSPTPPSEIRIRPQGANNVNDIAHVDLAWDVLPDLNAQGRRAAQAYQFDTYEFRRINQNDTIFAPAGGISRQPDDHAHRLRQGPEPARRHADRLGHPQPQRHRRRLRHLLQLPEERPGRRPRRLHAVSSITNGNARGNNRAVTETDRVAS
jgi:iron complex outermembrane receptor protein